MNSSEIEKAVQEVHEEGFTILKSLLPEELVRKCSEAFMPILEDFVREHADDPNRGTARHFIVLPFESPFNDPVIYENDTILAVVENIIGDDAALGSYATDTPLEGSVYQEFHSDMSNLFPGSDLFLPTHIVTVNFSFVDVTAENGPFEVARGTHRMPKEEALRRIESGQIQEEPLFMQVGDVLIRDPRCLHRGTPNRTASPRPVAVIAYARPWFRFDRTWISKSEYERMSERGKRLLRFIPNVES